MGPFIRKLIVLLSPFLLVLISFILLDPYNYIHSYFTKVKCQEYQAYDANKINAFEEFSKYVEYTSYIFGNSKSYAYSEGRWRNHIGEKEVVANLAAPGENISHIFNKLNFIEKGGLAINNVLLVLDKNIIKNFDGEYLKGIVYLHHPISTNSYYGSAVFDGFTHYTKNGFCFKYLSKVLGYQGDYNRNVKLTSSGTREFMESLESKYYFNKDSVIDASIDKHLKKEVFTNAKELDWIPELQDSDSIYLNQILKIFKRNKTNFKIIFGPYFYENGVSDKTVHSFNSIFGDSNVYDYSHKGEFFHAPIFWYDNAHYRAAVANQLMNQVYKAN